MIPTPYFRAKKIDSDEYNCGYLIRADDYEADADEDQIVYFIMHKMENYRTNEVWDFVCNSRIDPSTISIHFPDMLDSQGNKIFASLQQDGKGGDNVVYSDYKTIYTIVFDILKGVYAKNISNEYDTGYKLNPKLKIIGIQQ